MDILNDILDTLQLRGTVYFRTDFSPPWGIEVPAFSQAARFHMVVQGSCHVSFPSGRKVQLHGGDLLLVPRGRSHIIHDGDCTGAPALQTVLEEANYPGKGVLVINGGNPAASTQMVCGHFNFREGADHPLLRVLPEYLLVTAAMRGRHLWLDEILRLVTRKVFSEDVGASATVRRLSEVMFVELLQVSMQQSPALQLMLEGLQDARISRALDLMHRDPGSPWTVSELARQIGMSRSRFADRFRSLLGMGPMAYLADWRLQKALALLEQSNTNAQQVAFQTGYKSAAAFSRAFSSKFGVSPSVYRSRAAVI